MSEQVTINIQKYTPAELLEQVKALKDGAGKTWATPTEAMAVSPLPENNIPFRVKNNPPTAFDGDYAYMSTESNGYKFLGNSVGSTIESVKELEVLKESFEQLSPTITTVKTVEYNTVTNKGAGGVFAGFAIPFGVYQNFKTIKFAVRKTIANNPFNLKVWITENNKEGAVLAEKSVTGDVFGDGFIEVAFDDVILNTNKSSLCLVYAFDNKAMQLRTSNNTLINSPVIAYTTSIDYNTIQPNDFLDVSNSGANTYFGLPYIEIDVIKSNYVPNQEVINYISEKLPQKTEEIKVNISSEIYVTGGVEFQLYFGNIIKGNLDDYIIDINCVKGFQMEGYWAWTPNANNTEVGSYPLEFNVYSLDKELLFNKTINVICSSNVVSNQKCISVGDSTTAPSKQMEVISNEHPNDITFLGSQGTLPNNHEGRGGWKFSDYTSSGRKMLRFNVTSFIGSLVLGDVYIAENNSKWRVSEINISNNSGYFSCVLVSGSNPASSGVLTKESGTGANTINYTSFGVTPQNPFWNQTTNQLDFQAYLNELGVSLGSGDVVHFNLGINDVFGTYNETIRDNIRADINVLISMIRAYSNDVVIGFNLTIPPPKLQDGFGINYRNGQTRDLYADNNFRLVNDLIAEFDTEVHRNNKVFLLMTNATIDTLYGYQYAIVPLSNRVKNGIGLNELLLKRNDTNISNSDFVKLCFLTSNSYRLRINNGLHPSDVGYTQMADVLFGFLKFAKTV